MKKILGYGLLAGLIMFVASTVLSWLLNLLIPGLRDQYNSPVFRPWSDPLMSLMFVQPFIVGIILAWVWTRVKDCIKASGYSKGLVFALAYWIVSLPGMLISYGSFPISIVMIGTWSLSILVQSLLAGLIYYKTLK